MKRAVGGQLRVPRETDNFPDTGCKDHPQCLTCPYPLKDGKCLAELPWRQQIKYRQEYLMGVVK